MEEPESRQSPKDQSSQFSESALTPYSLAVRFHQERDAKQAYFRVQRLVFEAKDQSDLSTYRFLLEGISHVALVGEPPAAELDGRLRQALAAGDPVALPLDILHLLLDRRMQQARRGNWVEGHYRPGKPLHRGPHGGFL